MNRFGKILGGVVATASIAALGGVAAADQVQLDNDLATNGVQSTVSISADPGDPVSTGGQVFVSWQGSKHLNPSQTVTFTGSSSDLPAGATIGNALVVVPSTWASSAGATGTGAVNFTAPTTPGDYSYVVKWDPQAGFSCASDGCLSGSANLNINLHVNTITAANHAPQVAAAAADAKGTEGDKLSTSGSFTDEDGDDLTITADNTVGTFTDNGDGSWKWELQTTDDVALGTINVTAADEDGLEATDSFDFEAINAVPAVGTVTVTPTGACGISVSASFTDPGSADAHRSSIDWGDNSTDTDTDPDTSPVEGSHTYTTTGTKTVTVTVTDDDGGEDDNTGSFTTLLSVGAFGAPINTGSGPRSVFKLGSTIPVKVVLKDCAGDVVSTASPVVNLQKVDSVPDGSVNEPQINEIPTNGKVMRWDGTQYIYNLSTKNSQFSATGGALAAGTYKLWVGGTGIYKGADTYFDLK